MFISLYFAPGGETHSVKIQKKGGGGNHLCTIVDRNKLHVLRCTEMINSPPPPTSEFRYCALHIFSFTIIFLANMDYIYTSDNNTVECILFSYIIVIRSSDPSKVSSNPRFFLQGSQAKPSKLVDFPRGR